MKDSPDLIRAAFPLDLHPEREVWIARMEKFAALLAEVNQNMNLVADSTLPTLWARHMLDSAQLYLHLPAPAATLSLADIGSGAGFPGLVLAIMGVGRVHLIESVGKKADFLNVAREKLDLPQVVIHRERAESLKTVHVDVVTARAVAPLTKLLDYAVPLSRKGGMGLFLKGQKTEAELTEAAGYWTFRAMRTTSLSDPSGVVVAVSDLKAVRRHASSRPKTR